MLNDSSWNIKTLQKNYEIAEYLHFNFIPNRENETIYIENINIINNYLNENIINHFYICLIELMNESINEKKLYKLKLKKQMKNKIKLQKLNKQLIDWNYYENAINNNNISNNNNNENENNIENEFNEENTHEIEVEVEEES